MLKKNNKFGWNWFVGMIALIAITMSANAALPYEAAVKVSATVSTSPTRITLTWPANAGATAYTISRKAATGSSWQQVANVNGSTTSWADSNVAVGSAYEYQILAACNGYTATGYIYAGVNANLIESRGKVLLVVDNTYANQLASELTRLQQDLVGDGWTVVRKDFARNTPPPTIKSAIKSEYNNGGLRSVLIFGHIAVAYSGNFGPDGHHPDHLGAWASDSYYGDMDGTWTDSSVNNSGAEKPWNHNVPGDGKFDQSTIPSDLEIEVGRVDLANMTCFANKTPSRSELDLLRQYLNKDHNFRHGMLNIERRAVVCDNWGNPYGEAFGTAGWRIGSAFFGAQNTTAIPGGTFVSHLSSRSALFAWAGGGGSFYSEGGVATSDEYAANDVKAVFQLHLGSYFGDWDNESAYLRAPLGSTTATLATAWSGRPEWFLHHMALGETIGYGARKTQNNSGVYSPTYTGTRGVHVSLLGDPTLRLHPVIPPSNLVGAQVGSTVTLTWAPSTDSNIQGYYVYRSTSANGPFTRVTPDLLTAPTFVDAASPAGSVYMVRAVKLETSGSGTYQNASQGIFYPNNGGGGTPSAPIAPSNLIATSNGSASIRLAWSDNSANETGFKIERKVGVAGNYATVTTAAANATTFTDSGLTAGTVYFYRLSAQNTIGVSATVEATAATATGAPVTASATFVKVDSSTSGTWKGKYGSEGAIVMGDSSSLPGYVAITPRGNSSWTWQYSTTDTRALQRINAADRLASAWYLDGSFTVDLNFTDGQTHRVSMYFLDWDRSGRAQTVEILDNGSGAVLDSQTVSDFASGKYLTWDLKGAVTVRFTKASGFNAVLNGLFFGPASTTTGITQTTTASLTRQNLSVRINGAAGQVFKIYSSTNLTTWTEGPTVTLTGATYDYTDTANVTGGKFYRAVPQ